MTLNAAHIVLGGSLDREVGTEREMGELLALAEGAKHRAATMMNEHSSRAHSLLFLTLHQRTKRPELAGVSIESGVRTQAICRCLWLLEGF